MVRLDSVKLSVPVEALQGSKREAFSQEIGIDSAGNQIKDNLVIKGIGAGFKTATIRQRSGEVIIEASAKILLDDYPKLITINTIEQAVESMNQSGVITFDVPAFIEGARVLTCDSTTNIKPSVVPKDCIEALNLLRVNSNYDIEVYRQDQNNGIVFRGRQKTVKERMIFYDKLADVRKDRHLLKSVDKPLLLMNSFTGVLRVEQNHTSFRKIRDRFRIPDNRLISILNSQANPNFETFRRINTKYIDLSLFNDETYIDLQWNQLVDRLGIEYIIRVHQFEPDLIRQTMAKHFSDGTNFSRQFRKVKGVMAEMLARERDFQVADVDAGAAAILTEIGELLRAA